MTTITLQEAINIARKELGYDESTPGTAWLVRRLDKPSFFYFLVELGESNSVIAVATLDSETGKLGNYAILPGTGKHLILEKQSAIELAVGPEQAEAELVWMPSRVSKSPLYPFWRVVTSKGEKFVDQYGKITDKLGDNYLG